MSEKLDVISDAKITKVTVYPSQARITMKGSLDLKPGPRKVSFDDLPLSVIAESVRVSGKGEAKVRLMSVDVRRIHYEKPPLLKVRELEDRIEQLLDESRAFDDERAVQESQVDYLNGLRQASKQYARGLAQGRTQVEDQVALTQFFEEQDLQLRSSMRAINRKQRDKKRQIDKLRRELDGLKSAQPKERYQAIIDLEVLEEGTFHPELTYVVHDADWTPLYDIRLIEVDDGSTLQVTSLAQVTQRTGQDWDGVSLVVSTARPTLSQRLPELEPWYLDEYRSPVPMPRKIRAQQFAATQAPVTGIAESAEPVPPQPAAPAPDILADVAIAEAQGNESVISYQIPGGTDIPSDGSPHKVTLAQFNLSPEIDYFAVPKETDAVFRRVKALNDSSGPMLPGPVNLFVGDEFVGTAGLDYTAIDDEVELSLGVEERISVERELTRRDVDKARLRDRRQLQYGYKITLKNLLPNEVVVEIHDQIPVARHEGIKIKSLKLSPEPAEISDLNVYEWKENIPGGEELEINFEFLVEHPRSMKIIGLVE